MTRSDPGRALLDAVIAFYDGPGRAGDGGARSMLDAVAADLSRAAPFEPSPVPRAIGASALLPQTLRAIGNDPLTTLSAAIDRAAPVFRWRQNPNYTAANIGTAFMAGYGYVEFAGPEEALFRAEHIRVGLLLLGAGLHYPPHAHPAEETYHPLTAGGLWRRGDEAWRSVPAGHAIHHASMVAHETKATDRTLLALYCWRGDTATEARLTT